MAIDQNDANDPGPDMSRLVVQSLGIQRRDRLESGYDADARHAGEGRDVARALHASIAA
jgi:hypothetical protein